MTTDPSTVHPETVGPSDVERVEDLPVPPAELWDAVATPDGLAGWLADEVELDVRPGGTGRVRDDGEERVVPWLKRRDSAPSPRSTAGTTTATGTAARRA